MPTEKDDVCDYTYSRKGYIRVYHMKESGWWYAYSISKFLDMLTLKSPGWDTGHYGHSRIFKAGTILGEIASNLIDKCKKEYEEAK